MILRVISEEIALSTANTVGDNRVIRVYNDSGGDVLVTRTDEANTVVGSATVANGAVEFFDKNTSDTLEANSAVKATAVAFNIS